MQSDIIVRNPDLNLPLDAESTLDSKSKPKQEETHLDLFGEIDTVTIRGMPIHAVSLEQTVHFVIESSRAKLGGWVVTPNLDILRRHTRSVSFRNLVATSTINVADGMPLVWVSRILGDPVPERVNGTDLMVEICKAVSQSISKQTVFFLGGDDGTAEKTAEKLTDRFPGLNVAGCYCPEFGFESDMNSIETIAQDIRDCNPDIVFVGLGSPKQDVLINMLRLQFPSIWWLGVGVSFSFISGDLARAPKWAKKCGFEWLYRLFAEPKRLAKRYLFQGIPFFTTTLVLCLLKRPFVKSKRTKVRENFNE